MSGKRVAKPNSAPKDAERTAAGTETGVLTKKEHSKAPWIALAAVAALLIVAVVGVCVYANGYSQVFPGVTLDGEKLSGLSRGEVEDRISPEKLLQGTVTITANGEELGAYTQQELGAEIDQTALVDEVWQVGRRKGALGWLENGLTMVKGLMGGENDVSVIVAGYDNALLRRTAASLAADFDRDPIDGSYELSREGLFATKPADGQKLDQAGLVKALTDMGGSAGEVEAPWKPVKGKELDLEQISQELTAEASPAKYDIASGKVVDGEVGVHLDTQAAASALESAAPGDTVQLPADIVYPEMTAEELEKVLFKDVLGTATTNVSGTTARRGNVKLAGSAVNGTILNPGDIFDYNKVVGQRTAAKGYGAAGTYVNGETVNTIGGGICQVSSTIYLTSLRSNLEIVTRANHRFWPGYIPLGMDATVSWGGPEFRFKNNTNYPIRIDVSYVNNKLTVTFMGTKTDDTYVEMTYKQVGYTARPVVYEETDSLPYGTQKVKQSGHDGYKVETYRNVYAGDGTLISSKLEAVSNYSTQNKIILTGTAGRPAEGNPGENPGGGDVPAGGETDIPGGGETGGEGTGGESGTPGGETGGEGGTPGEGDTGGSETGGEA